MAKENVNQNISNEEKSEKSGKMAEECSPATSQTDLDINNVRTRLLAGGDMWWNLQDARYEIPKVPAGSDQVSKHSMFAGALWIGGIDAGGQLKMAAQTYRQSGNDFWTGPLNEQGSVEDVVCSNYDRHWKVTRSEIDEVRAIYEESGSVNIAEVPQTIREWPASGNPYAVGANNTPLSISVNRSMAPFVDINGDGVYNPEDGDYPDVKGDQAIWWVYNDKGNIHTETGGEAIGLEIKATAFAFNTNDEVNNMTFYSYDITNYSTVVLDSVFFGQWVDPDLGNFQDDFVGCDTARGLGICYNGDAFDEGAAGYGANPPLIGVDFFQGPQKYIYSGDTIVDSTRLGMSKFLYYNNDFSTIGNPEVASHYYGYLSGTWKDGSPFTFGGNGYNTGVPTDFMFPSDPSDNSPGAWSECAEGNTPFDRRFLQSAGPFRLEPDAKNEVVVGVVWVRPPNQSGCQADFSALNLADDKAQALYDNNFELIDGPDAPDMKIRELDQEIVLSLEDYNDENTELYEEADPVIKSIIDGLNDPSITDSTYNFQGYIIYQLANNQVTDYRDLSVARPIYQVDIEDGVSKIVNFEQDNTVEALVPQLMVDGNDNGISHTFNVTQDAFASGDQTLVNNRPYYFSVVAYAHNDYIPYEPGNEQSQLQPYLEGRGNIKVYSGVPHLTSPEAGGTILNAEYGTLPEITRLEGYGNGHRVIDLTDSTVNNILDKTFEPYPVYKQGFGPVEVKIYDPFKVPNADFVLQIWDTLPRVPAQRKELNRDASWYLENQANGEVIHSENTIRLKNERVIPEYGISITIKQTANPGTDDAINNGFIEATKEYASPQNRWLSGISDGEGKFPGSGYFNWIRAGSSFDPNPDNQTDYDDYYYPSDSTSYDAGEVYEGVLDGTFAPAALTAGFFLSDPMANPFAPGRRAVNITNNKDLFNVLKLDSLASIDLVLTDDKSKWTRCIVVETQPDDALAEGGVTKLGLRDHPSLNLDGTYSATETGRSWFPGYAINVETGKRLNIIFGEDSWLTAENGADMIWNPTSTTQLATGPSGRTYLFGGKHYIYISNTEYDEGEWFKRQYEEQFTVRSAIAAVFERTQWVSIPMLAQGSELKSFEDGLIPTETKIRLRVGKPYTDYNVDNDPDKQPRYFFSLGQYAPQTEQVEVADSALDEIRAVPNPYYAYSEYEGSKLDNRIKITNLPPSCVVTIYSTDGVLVRRFVRDNPFNTTSGAEIGSDNFDTSLEWDLRNNRNVPVASGIYLIHVNAPGIGEKTIKWFGTMRPLDFDNF
jgi:hypothetical protein